MSELKPKEIVAWFREKSREFESIADTLESTFGGADGSMPIPNGVDLRLPLNGTPPPLPSVNLDTVRAFVTERGAARIGTIADEMHANRNYIEQLIQANLNVFQVAGRGWVKVRG